MENPRFRLVYIVLVPALITAACVLGYYSYLTAAQFQRLGEKSIAESSLSLLEGKVTEIDTQIVAADNRAFAAIDLDNSQDPVGEWKRQAEEISPSARAVIVLNESAEVVAYVARAAPDDQRTFLRLFVNQIEPDLELATLRDGRLKHLHKTYDGSNYLISYKAQRHEGRRYFLVVHHDTGYIVRTVFPEAFKSEPGRPTHNVIDSDNRRIFGPSLADAGDYVVGRRFPTTLYMWRLQVAPTTAPLLQAKGRTSRFNQVALIALSLAIIFVAVGFILYAADRERRLAGMKSDFIANVSHELKTPLSVIRMFGEMLLTGRVPNQNKQHEYLEIICSESERLSGLIENVLDFAALERGKRRYEMENRDLTEVVARAIENMRYRAEREGAEIALRSSGGPAHCLIDEQAMLLVVINLLDNAVKYGGGTAIEVSVETRSDEVLVRVRDHGPGIPEQELARVFERFYRTAKNRHSRGSGIGLAIVKRIAQEHHGRAWAENAAEGGAIVAVAIPRRDPTAVHKTEERTPRETESAAIDSATAADIVARNG